MLARKIDLFTTSLKGKMGWRLGQPSIDPRTKLLRGCLLLLCPAALDSLGNALAPFWC
jgi:hypothetical protein